MVRPRSVARATTSAFTPPPVPPAIARGSALAQHAVELDQGGDVTGSLPFYLQAVHTLPGVANIRAYYGWALARTGQAAESLRIGLLQTLSPAPLYIAMERGYFRDEGLDASFRFFQAAQPIAAAAVAGDVDVGITALTGGFFSLAGR